LSVFCSTLIPKANSWLLDNAGLQLIKCETVEKKLTSVDEVTTDNVLFVPRNNHAVYIKGLRYIPSLYYCSFIIKIALHLSTPQVNYRFCFANEKLKFNGIRKCTEEPLKKIADLNREQFNSK
jgi:hypothetical protein